MDNMMAELRIIENMRARIAHLESLLKDEEIPRSSVGIIEARALREVVKNELSHTLKKYAGFDRGVAVQECIDAVLVKAQRLEDDAQ